MYLKRGETMYREKLTEQLELLEKLQKACVVIDEAIALSRCILDISKELDDIHRQKHTADPLETMKQAFKETLDNNKD